VAGKNKPGCTCCGAYDCDNPGEFAVSMGPAPCMNYTSICRRADDGFNCCACVVLYPFTDGCRQMLCSDTFAAQFGFSGTAQHNYYTAGAGANIVPLNAAPPAPYSNCCCSEPALQATLDYSFSKTINVKPIITSEPLYVRVCVYFTDTLTTGDTEPVKRWVVYSEYWKRYYVSYSGSGSTTYSRTIPAVPLCHEKWNVDSCESNCYLNSIHCIPNDPDNVNFWISQAREYKDIPTARVKVFDTKPSGIIGFNDDDLGEDYEIFGCKAIGQLYEATQVEFDIPDAPCLCDGINPRDVYSPTLKNRPHCWTGVPRDCNCSLNENNNPHCPPFWGTPGTEECRSTDGFCFLDPMYVGGNGTLCWEFTPVLPHGLDFCSPRCYEASAGDWSWVTTCRTPSASSIGQYCENPCTGTASTPPNPDITANPFDISQGNCVSRMPGPPNPGDDEKGCWAYGPIYIGRGNATTPGIDCHGAAGPNEPWPCWFRRLIFPVWCSPWVGECPINCYDSYGTPTSPDSSCFNFIWPENGCAGRGCLCNFQYCDGNCYKHAWHDWASPPDVQSTELQFANLQINSVSYSVTCSVGDKVLVQHPSPTWGFNLDWTQTPDPTNWTTIEYDCAPNTSTITSKQITGVSVAGSIQLRINPGTGSAPVLYYKITSTQQTGTVTGPPDGTWTAITATTTITVNNNEWVSFCTYDSTCSTNSRTATVTANPGACESELDTFTYQSTFTADVTPCSVNWTTTTFNSFLAEANIVSQQITCINTTITLQIQPGSGSDPTLYYKITSTQQTGNVTGSPDGTWTAVTSNTNISVSNNEWISFVANGTPFSGTRTATIVNVSDSSTTLDTFNYVAT